VKRGGKALGQHAQSYNKDSSLCTYCHSGTESDLPNSKFCKNCHKLPIPHQIDEGDQQKYVHKTGFQKGTLKKATCARCHETKFCNDCHHPGGSKASKPWVHYHPVIVKKDGAAACLESCHKETFCSDCHVNHASKL
jgi:hypothetical protein